ncbi:MAG: hypothetical protein PHE03_06905 [Bacteroidales bacterium]|nr:hypothetical protein [Bacteroidales bacterium]
MKKYLAILIFVCVFLSSNSQTVVRTVTGDDTGYYTTPIQVYRYDSIDVDISVWEFQLIMDEGWTKCLKGEIFDFDFVFSLKTAKSKAQENDSKFNFEIMYPEYYLYTGGWSDEPRGPFKFTE